MKNKSKILSIIMLVLIAMGCGDKATYQEKLNKYNNLVKLADSLNYQGKYEEAYPYANSAIKLTDTLSAAYYAQGRAFYNLGWSKDAKKSFDKIIKLEGEKSKAFDR